jgi:hypothetical protein
MKYTVAWANVLTQNTVLKGTVVALSVAVFVFTFATLKLALRSPFIIDRECYSKVATPGDNKHTAFEMEQFIKSSLEKRFNTEAQDVRAYIAEEEVQYRFKEQEDLAKKGITQKLIVNSIKVEGSTATVDSDRIMSAGKVRSALFFPLKVTLASSDRTASNPYGLTLRKVSQIQEGSGK